MNKTILQIPVDKKLRDQAALAATKMGFSSLQESIRIFMKQMSTQDLQVRIEPKAVQLSPKAIKRYDKITKDFEANHNVFTARNAKELMHHLGE